MVIPDVHRYLADHSDIFVAQPNSVLAALRAASVRGINDSRVIAVGIRKPLRHIAENVTENDIDADACQALE